MCNVSFNLFVRYELCMCAGFGIFSTARENALAENSYSQIIDGYLNGLNSIKTPLEKLLNLSLNCVRGLWRSSGSVFRPKTVVLNLCCSCDRAKLHFLINVHSLLIEALCRRSFRMVKGPFKCFLRSPDIK